MNSLRGLSLRIAGLATLLPGAALAHSGHGASGAHSHGELAAVALAAVVVGGIFYFARRQAN